MLGESLWAEIDLPEISADEAATLKINSAPPSAYAAAGLDYNPLLASLQITLKQRADGAMYLQLGSAKAVTDPFVDLRLEVTWSSGRIVRDYTLLFDPPNLRPDHTPAFSASSTAPPPRKLQTPQPPTAPPQPAPHPAAKALAPVARTALAPSTQVTVRSGDTASHIAAAHKPAGVSLDQMLVALLRANPSAFISGNVNLLKANAVLNLPDAQQAAAVAPAEARQTVVAQSRAFDQFRRKLAQGTPTTQVAAASREAAGKLGATVRDEDKRSSDVLPDKLTLSRGAVQGKAAEDQLAKTRQAQETSQRLAELSKNISELDKLRATAGSAAASAATAPADPTKDNASSSPADSLATDPAAPHAAASAAPQPDTTASSAVASASATTAAPASSAAVEAVVAASTATAPPATASSLKPAAAKPAPPLAPPKPGLLDDLLDNPLLLPLAAGVVVLLAGFGLYRLRRRKTAAPADSSFIESRLQSDSFFGASGGQRIDTNEPGAADTSMLYSPSQLDATGDVDPVAEADVYLAYGRELQAEEILKEALHAHPQRVAIHGKLLEIYAKRGDVEAFEQVATQAYALTQGAGQEWAHICELGRELDATNSLYQSGRQPSAVGASSLAGAAAAAGTPTAARLTAPKPDTAKPAQPAAQPGPVPNMDSSLANAPPPAPQPPPPPAPAPSGTPAPMRPDTRPAAASPGAPAFGSDLPSLDLGPAPGPQANTTAFPLPPLKESNSSLGAKLALAREFHAIGDIDGARSLAQELLAEASGSLQAEAQRFLDELG